MNHTLYWEDFRAGQRFLSDTFSFSAQDFTDFGHVSGDRHPMHMPQADRNGEPLIGHGPLGLARYFGTLNEMGFLQKSIIALLDTHWHYRRPLEPNQPLHYETVITGTRLTSKRDRGIVRRCIRLLDADDQVMQEGTSSAMVRTRHEPDPSKQTDQDLLGVAWCKVLAEKLNALDEFRESLQLFDGCIALSSEYNTTQLRIYKGRVIDVGRRTPKGADFTLSGTELAWVELFRSDRVDFVARATHGEFNVSGNVFVYLQITSAIVQLVEVAKTLIPAGDR
ncbi:MaoC family dehydratase [Salinicola acroporae]|uniref:MaoC-like domain-containing protein n=1 Tax=Salinicola acroporae TaxID=1541440 RepID=A0ABT6I5R6_9GAMM|nr:hypothetical protein [Salinicola acroporae]MDH4572847.1 hypothetical protein [Salinicola acroporae]